MTLPSDYSQRVYAGVLGKMIGVYLGRPFEGWSYQKIIQQLGEIHYYVNDQLNQPLVVTDDDIAGTFTFIRALEDFAFPSPLTAEQVGQCWLNYIIEQRTILWWGGNGNSTEHTAWLNLKKGIPAPSSGAIATNGKTVAEQIGAQIFIDSWALVSPGNPRLAARLAQAAASVSHDGEAVYAAMLWAAMEAEAFVSRDITHLIATGLSVIPADSLIARLIADIIRWRTEDDDWRATRQRIEEQYGYRRYPGNCHVIPNHALMIMAILYAPHNFQQALRIINTSGWDTDCNSGNVGCLAGIMLGLQGIDEGPDWRGPLADRLLISSADGGFSINDAVRITDYLVNIGRHLAGAPPQPAPKSGAQFHFSLPGSVQGFRCLQEAGVIPLSVGNTEIDGNRMLSLRYHGLAPGLQAIAVTPTFMPAEVTLMKTYDLQASPLIYPGQQLRASLLAAADNINSVAARLCYRTYDENDRLKIDYGEPVSLNPGEKKMLQLSIPAGDGQPIGEIGVALTTAARHASGQVCIDYFRQDGEPSLHLSKPAGENHFWWRAWVNGVDIFSRHYPASFRISQEYGEGMIGYGTRQWRNYRVQSDITLHLGKYGGIAFHVQGLRRYYAVRITSEGKGQLVRRRDDDVVVLAESDIARRDETPVAIDIRIAGRLINVCVDGIRLQVNDDSPLAPDCGGIGLLVYEGALSTDAITISPVALSGCGQ